MYIQTSICCEMKQIHFEAKLFGFWKYAKIHCFSDLQSFSKSKSDMMRHHIISVGDSSKMGTIVLLLYHSIQHKKYVNRHCSKTNTSRGNIWKFAVGSFHFYWESNMRTLLRLQNYLRNMLCIQYLRKVVYVRKMGTYCFFVLGYMVLLQKYGYTLHTWMLVRLCSIDKL